MYESAAKELIQTNTKGFENETGLRERMMSEKKSRTDMLLTLLFKKDDISEKDATLIKTRMENRVGMQKEVPL